MTLVRAPTVDEAYRRRVAELRDRVVAILRAQFRDAIDPADIAASFAAFLEDAVPLLAAGQETAQDLALGYVASLVAAAEDDADELLDPDAEAVGTTAEGLSLRDAFAAIGPVMLGRIGEGFSLEEALAYGEYLVVRTADAEVTAAADAEADRQVQASTSVTGWEGIVQPGACVPCQANAGLHPLSEPIYRHPDCGCEKTYVIQSKDREAA